MSQREDFIAWTIGEFRANHGRVERMTERTIPVVALTPVHSDTTQHHID